MKYILGDNPFFGVSHSGIVTSIENEKDRYRRASAVIVESISAGFSSLMLSAHKDAERLLSELRPTLSTARIELEIALVIPYPHTLNDAIARRGYIGAFREVGDNNTLGFTVDLVQALVFQSARSRKALLKRYINLEVRKFHRDRVRVTTICLHNIVTDMLLALGRTDIILDFIDACNSIEIKPVIITQNLINAISVSSKVPYTICFSYNSLGYMVNPSLEDVNSLLDCKRNYSNIEFWAMQILASGSLGLSEAFESGYLSKFHGILYATSKSERISEFSDFVKKNIDPM